MISERADKPPQNQKAWRDILFMVLVFLLLAILVWRWFDFRIAHLKNEPVRQSSSEAIPVSSSNLYTR